VWVIRLESWQSLMRVIENEKLLCRATEKTVSSDDLARLQREQHSHDMRNHFDIISLHKTDRLKHYGLHFAKYVGRLARESEEVKPVERTLVDTLLVSLSAANTLHQDLSKEGDLGSIFTDQGDPLRMFADAAGRFADACEKIDHMEEFVPLARRANSDILKWIVRSATQRQFDLDSAVSARRAELRARQFFIRD
jgi:hypothetical protein